jgi:purine-binding chemotaxis protein CheW
MQRNRHDPSKSLVGFVVGEVEYAAPIAHVKEIANPLPLVALPHAPRSVVGVADYRGAVVPVVDLRTRFGMPSAPPTRKTKWIVVDVGSPAPDRADAPGVPATVPAARLIALVVDAVTEVFGTGGSELRTAPALGTGDEVRGIAGVATHLAGLVFVLDTVRLRDLADAVRDSTGGADSASGQLPSLPARTAT